MKIVARLEEKHNGVQCVDVVECTTTKQRFVDKHTLMTTPDRAVAAAALKELDCHLSLASSSQSTFFVHMHKYYLSTEDQRLHMLHEYYPRGDLLSISRQELRLHRAGFDTTGATVCEDGIRRLARELLEGVASMHACEIAHMDLSLENVFLTESNHVRIGDFGNAQRFTTEQGGKEIPMSIAKPTYASPELYEAVKTQTRVDLTKTDAWAVGVMLWQLWTKMPLFKEATPADAFFQEMQRVGTRQALEQNTFLLSTPSGLVDLLAQLLDIYPSTRLSVNEALQHPWISMQSTNLLCNQMKNMTLKPSHVVNTSSSKMPTLAVNQIESNFVKKKIPTDTDKKQRRDRTTSVEIALETTRISIRPSNVSFTKSTTAR